MPSLENKILTHVSQKMSARAKALIAEHNVTLSDYIFYFCQKKLVRTLGPIEKGCFWALALLLLGITIAIALCVPSQPWFFAPTVGIGLFICFYPYYIMYRGQTVFETADSISIEELEKSYTLHRVIQKCEDSSIASLTQYRWGLIHQFALKSDLKKTHFLGRIYPLPQNFSPKTKALIKASVPTGKISCLGAIALFVGFLALPAKHQQLGLSLFFNSICLLGLWFVCHGAQSLSKGIFTVVDATTVETTGLMAKVFAWSVIVFGLGIILIFNPLTRWWVGY